MRFVSCGVLAFAGMVGTCLQAQNTAVQAEPGGSDPASVQRNQNTPIYRIEVVDRTIKAVNYRHRGGATKVDFRGTALLPRASGEAKVESKQGYTEIEVEFDELDPATKFGPEYLTYVLWAITPEGRATNLGEVLLNGNRGKLNVTTEMQAFGLIITAEPYFAVTQPSDAVVMENVVRPDTRGSIEVVEAKYELLPRGQYRYDPALWAGKQAVVLDRKVPLELYEARNAVAISKSAGADQYAQDTLNRASALLQQAESYQARDQKKPTVMVAREAAQTAEDARLLAVRRAEEARLANEKQAEAERTERARAQAEAAEQARLEAQRDAERAAREKAQADAARAAALQQQQQAQMEAERARQAAEDADRMRMQADQQRAQLRRQLQQQLNEVLETRETARGLIVNMSDVLFDFNKYTLKPGAREKLAKISGILLAHPGLKLDVQGYTDSVGTEQYNEELSRKRAESVREFLVQQGVSPDSVLAEGFGEDNPVASNNTPSGRQQNRRVEIVVSGAPIGTKGEVGQ